MAIKAVLSDLGNVVATFPYICFVDRFHQLPEVQAAHPPTVTDLEDPKQWDELEALMWGIVKQHELGHFRTGEFMHRVSRAFGLKETISWHDFYRLFGDVFTLNEPVAQLWHRLRNQQGIVLTAVSNLCPMHEKAMRHIGAFNPFDHVLLSYREGMRKPSVELMVRALDRSGSAAEEAVFIDDLSDNLVPATELGINTYLFDGDFRRLTAYLAGLGLPIEP